MRRKHKPQIVQGSQLADAAWDQCDGQFSRFSEVLTAEGDFKTETRDQWFACVWGHNCVTTQHLGDASIHGPFDTAAEAEDYVTPNLKGTEHG
jgi:hypothetical protein